MARSREGWVIEIAGRFIQILAIILMVAIFIRVLLLWVGMETRNSVVIVLRDMTEPLLVPIRRLIPPFAIPPNGMLDLSPLMAIILLLILSLFVTSLLA